MISLLAQTMTQENNNFQDKDILIEKGREGEREREREREKINEVGIKRMKEIERWIERQEREKTYRRERERERESRGERGKKKLE